MARYAAAVLLVVGGVVVMPTGLASAVVDGIVGLEAWATPLFVASEV